MFKECVKSQQSSKNVWVKVWTQPKHKQTHITDSHCQKQTQTATCLALKQRFSTHTHLMIYIEARCIFQHKGTRSALWARKQVYIPVETELYRQTLVLGCRQKSEWSLSNIHHLMLSQVHQKETPIWHGLVYPNTSRMSSQSKRIINVISTSVNTSSVFSTIRL